MRALLINDRFTRGSVLAGMLSTVGGLRLVASVTGADVAMTWLAVHPNDWDVSIVTLEEDAAQLEVIAFARAANPRARIVVFGSIVSGGVRAECLRCGADAAFSSRQPGDFALWLSELRAPWERPEAP